MKVLFDPRVTQAETRWPGKLIKKAKPCETKHMEGIPPPLTETSVRPQHLTETKCEQICTRKREITSAHFNPHASPKLPKKSRRLCTVARRRRRLMRTEREVEEEKKEIKENIWRGDLQLWRNVSTAARAEAAAAAASVWNWRSDSTGRVAGPGKGGRLKMALRLLLSALNKSIKSPLKAGSHISFSSCYW